MTARIYRPARNAMQSGKANTEQWFLEFEREEEPTLEPLMGWTSCGDMKQQVRLVFRDQGAGDRLRAKEGIAFEVKEDEPKRAEKKTYADNFRWGAKENWTH